MPRTNRVDATVSGARLEGTKEAHIAAERDLLERQLEGTSFRLVELCAGLRTLNEQLKVRQPSKVQNLATKDLVDRMILRANSAYAAVLCHEHALHTLRKETGNQ